ncbi:MAG TPA: TOMM precursor leader peptide-binding protein [Kribbellaceae bacterium]
MAGEERLLLRPGTVLLHRTGRPGTTRIQLGSDPRYAVRIDVPAASCDAVLAGLDGTMTEAQVLAAAVARGADEAAAAALLRRLRAARALVEPGWLDWTHDLPDGDRARRLPDLYAWDQVADVTAVAERRRTASVGVVGAGRTGAAVALLLAAARVGRLEIAGAGLVEPADVTPYGYRPEHVGRPRHLALRDLLTAVSPAVTVAGAAGRAEVVVLVPDTREPDRDELAALLRADLPHLLVRHDERGGSVGPFVLPGRSACVRCTDLHRTDVDADWPVLLAQLGVAPAPGPDTVLAAQLAALAAAQVLHWLAGETPATAGTVIEIGLAGGAAHRREWQPHPCCGCHWPSQLAADDGENDAAGNSLAG